MIYCDFEDDSCPMWNPAVIADNVENWQVMTAKSAASLPADNTLNLGELLNNTNCKIIQIVYYFANNFGNVHPAPNCTIHGKDPNNNNISLDEEQ